MSASTPLTAPDARHLLRRTGFGATVLQTDRLLDSFATRGGAVDSLLDFKPSKFKPGGRYVEDIHNKWVRYMIKTKLPLQEKLVLFWHDHFATSFDKVGDVTRMALQNRLLRGNCRGNFKTFVKAINKNAAMMEFLDTVRNRAAEPNENYSREVQELFTLGVKDPLGNDNYTQEDIVQIARAFSGWDYDDKDVAEFLDYRHDYAADYPERGPKVIFKTRGNFGNPGGQSFTTAGEGAAEIDTVTDIIFAHRYGPGNRHTVADYIGRKLVSYFAHPNPSTAFVNAVVDASGFASTWELTPLLKEIFVHDGFYLSAAPPAAGSRKSVKWPVDFLVTTLRLLNVRLRSKYQYIEGGSYQGAREMLTNMGQILFEPPSVFGWDWETAWLSSSTLLARYGFGRDIAGAREGGGTSFRPERLFALGETNPGAIVDAVTTLLGVDDQISGAERSALILYLTDGAGPGASVDLSDDQVRFRKLGGLVATVLQSPIYQLH
ncbi:MAG: DUF1800 domain-containing protein [Candidatus Binatia bacterium]